MGRVTCALTRCHLTPAHHSHHYATFLLVLYGSQPCLALLHTVMLRPPLLSRRPKTIDEYDSPLHPKSSNSTLAEALRRNPFRPTTQTSVSQELEDETKALNEELLTLAGFFPDVQIDVLRGLLVRFDGDSRLPICTEQLIKYKSEWTNGRIVTPARDAQDTIPVEEQFRSKEYVAAVNRTLYVEFRSLGRSVVDAVLAEKNFSYQLSRPLLQGLANNSWRTTFTNIFRKRRSQEEAPAELLDRGLDTENPRLRPTGSGELDEELEMVFFKRVLAVRARTREAADRALASSINQQQAQEAEALFECQVCYDDVPFEQVTTCTIDGHVVCLDCVRRTLQEALFGQGWNRSVDTRFSTLKCLAPATADDCPGHIPQELCKNAVVADKAGEETWTKFNERLADQALQTSQLSVVRCLFCPYAEADQAHDLRMAKQLRWHFRRPNPSNTLIFILIMELVPMMVFLLLPIYIIYPFILLNMFYKALNHHAISKRTSRFRCLNPSCKRSSCLKCYQAWHDPHTCHEPLIVSLRTSVEAARTAAIKRTCPRCGTSFVKSSGCNKLTCVCGYAMCYLCRKNIGKNGEEGGQGYRHFCEHFRINPGQKCTQCDKCDLYKAEDEDWMVKKAGEEAEKAWRVKEGMVGVEGLEHAVGNLAGEDTVWRRFRDGRWSVQGCVNFAVEKCVVVEVP